MKARCQRRDQAGFVFQPGSENEPDRLACRRPAELFQRCNEWLRTKASGHCPFDDTNVFGGFSRIEIAEGINDEGAKSCAPGGLREAPPGERGDEDVLPAQRLGQADKLLGQLIGVAEVERQRFVGIDHLFEEAGFAKRCQLQISSSVAATNAIR